MCLLIYKLYVLQDTSGFIVNLSACVCVVVVDVFVVVVGNAMWIEMNSTDSLSHAIINVECVDDSADISRAETVSCVCVFYTNTVALI